MEKDVHVSAISGWGILVVNIILLALSVALIHHHPALGMTGIGVSIFLLAGYYTLQPNESRLLLLFGSYKGTVKKSGFFWGNPLYSRGWSFDRMPSSAGTGPEAFALKSKTKVSLRLRTLNVPTLKVNDQSGNPIEIGAVVVWRIVDAACATFEVEDYLSYVRQQSETSLRHLANSYPYDNAEGDQTTLRSGLDEVSQAFKKELQEKFQSAGIQVEEARLSHLAYAPEIAQVMLRRQQAEAVIAARRKIVHGAVSMVEMALNELSEKNLLELDQERKAAMVNNLLVVLCAERESQPVVNTGTLYT